MAVNGIEIKLGQVWQTRAGEQVTITIYDGHETHPWNSDADSYCDDGKVFLSWGEGPDRNLAQLILDTSQSDAPTVNMTVPGYESLANVLQMAYNQAAVGKGVERHAAAGEPFDKQIMQIGAQKFGSGALLFQAFKKSEESQRLPLDRAVNELLGAIVYLAGAVIALKKSQVKS